jgi:hypothetical protein
MSITLYTMCRAHTLYVEYLTIKTSMHTSYTLHVNALCSVKGFYVLLFTMGIFLKKKLCIRNLNTFYIMMFMYNNY